MDLPEARFRYAALTWDAPEVEWRDLTLAEGADQIALDLLGDPDIHATCPGGAVGEFCFDAAARSICIEINEVSTAAAHCNSVDR